MLTYAITYTDCNTHAEYYSLCSAPITNKICMVSTLGLFLSPQPKIQVLTRELLPVKKPDLFH